MRHTSQTINMFLSPERMEAVESTLDAMRFSARIVCRSLSEWSLHDSLKSDALSIVMFEGADILVEKFKKLEQKLHLVCLTDGDLVPIIESELSNQTIAHIGLQYHRCTGEILHRLSDHRVLRLGQVKEKISKSEPIIRECDVLWVDTSVLDFASCMTKPQSPFGLNGFELCQILHYAGESKQCNTVMMTYNENASSQSLSENVLLSACWYYANALDLREDCSIEDSAAMDRYVVELENNSLEFYRSIRSDKWWLKSDLIDIPGQTIPCTEDAYQAAIKNRLPEEILIRL